MEQYRLLIRFDDGDELVYGIDWERGCSFSYGAIGCEFLEGYYAHSL